MKKYFFLALGFSTLIISSSTFAAGSCTIESTMSKELTTYMSDLESTLSKLEQASSKGSCGADNTASDSVARSTASIKRGVNLGLSQDCYLSSAAFTVELGLKSETPKGLRRDLDALISQNNRISNSIKNIYANCGDNVPVVVKDILPYSGLDTRSTVWDLAVAVLRSHTELACTYRDIAVGKPPLVSSFLLTPSEFIQDLEKSYGPTAQETCNKESDVFKQLKDAINKLGTTSKRISGSMEIWQSAELKTESEAEISERERKKEEGGPTINRAWLVENSSEAVTRANTTSTPKEGGEGISGWLRNAGLRMANTFEDMKSLYTFAPTVSEAKTTDEWLAIYKNREVLVSDIGAEVTAKFKSLADQIGDEQVSKDTYEGKLGRIYIELESATKLLGPYRKVAQKICSQDQTSNAAGSGCVPAK